MPELPEVETLRRDLEPAVIGRRVVAVEATGVRSVRRHGEAALRSALTGRTFTAADRLGKYLLIRLDDGGVLVVHLRMSGQLLHVPDPGRARAPHTHVVLGLDDGSELRFVDPRTFGEVFVSRAVGDSGIPVELATLGSDALTARPTARRLGVLLSRRRTALKAFLLDQRAIAGLGNIYADEALFAARLRPDRRTDSLDQAEVARLAGAISRTLRAAVAARGSTLRDARYADLAGRPGAYQDRHAVYGRPGKPCPRCGTPVRRVRLAGRSAHYCAACQS